MSASSASHSCPTCGAPLPANAPGRLCPACLLRRVAAPTEPGPGGPAHRLPPPPLATVAATFPQLEVLELIGQGGMGCVFKARQPQLNRFVALKILPEALARDPAFAARFTREAQTLAALSHPNIVTIHDFGQAGGFFYLLMEFVDGVNLREALRGGRFAPEQALAMVPPLCDALQFAHDRGVIHRDIKPENLLLDRDGRVKVADFGIARLLAAEAGPPRPSPDTLAPLPGGSRGERANRVEGQPSPGLTGDSAAGTPGYMAPEQRTSPHRVDRRADIYSLGVVLYEMLTGELPGQPLDPPSRRIHVDVRLDEIVLRALEREPERRYQQASAVKTAVETVQTSAPPQATASAPPGAGAAMTPPTGDSRRQRKLWYGFLVSVLGLPVGLLMGLPVVWGLALAGIIVGAAKLGFFGGAVSPLPALLRAILPATLVVGRGAFGPRSRGGSPADARERRRRFAIIAGIVLLVVAIPSTVTFLTLGVLRLVRSAPARPMAAISPPTAGFDATREVVLRRDGDLAEAFLDLETGRVASAPEDLVRSLKAAGHLSGRGTVSILPVLEWMRTNHVDLVCRDGPSGLTLVDGMGLLVAAPAAAGAAFESRSAGEVAGLSAALAEVLAVHTNREPGNVAMFWFEPHTSEHTWGIRTRTGRAGLIEVRPEDVRSDSIRFRYKLVDR